MKCETGVNRPMRKKNNIIQIMRRQQTETCDKTDKARCLHLLAQKAAGAQPRQISYIPLTNLLMGRQTTKWQIAFLMPAKKLARIRNSDVAELRDTKREPMFDTLFQVFRKGAKSNDQNTLDRFDFKSSHPGCQPPNGGLHLQRQKTFEC